MRNALFVMSLLSTTLLWPAFAFGYCTEPESPYCVRDYQPRFESDFEFQDCRRKLERMIQDLDAYVDCLNDEVEEVNRAAEKARREAKNKIDEAKYEAEQANDSVQEAIKKFNCKAEGNGYCY